MIVGALFLSCGGVMLMLSEGKDLFLALGSVLFGLVLVAIGYLQLRSGKRDVGQGLPLVPVSIVSLLFGVTCLLLSIFAFMAEPSELSARYPRWVGMLV